MFTLDGLHGLRAWSTGTQELLATCPIGLKLDQQSAEKATPSSLAVDSNTAGHISIVALATSSGGVLIYVLNRELRRISPFCTFSLTGSSAIFAIAIRSTYLATLDEARTLNVFVLPESPSECFTCTIPRILTTVKSSTELTNMTLSISISTAGLVTSCVYALPSYPTGWTINLQEINLSLDGTIAHTRLASPSKAAAAFTSGYQETGMRQRRGTQKRNSSKGVILGPSDSASKPTTLSYAHPYLLASYPDNTLNLYLIQSTAEELNIHYTGRLWGHTSSISSACVGNQGKAITVARSGEIRAWNLNNITRPKEMHNSINSGPDGIAIRSLSRSACHEHNPRASSSTRAQQSTSEASPLTTDVVGFDDERVVILAEKCPNVMTLITHDFS